MYSLSAWVIAGREGLWACFLMCVLQASSRLFSRLYIPVCVCGPNSLEWVNGSSRSQSMPEPPIFALIACALASAISWISPPSVNVLPAVCPHELAGPVAPDWEKELAGLKKKVGHLEERERRRNTGPTWTGVLASSLASFLGGVLSTGIFVWKFLPLLGSAGPQVTTSVRVDDRRVAQLTLAQLPEGTNLDEVVRRPTVTTAVLATSRASSEISVSEASVYVPRSRRR